ncbi:hypothetical protein ACJJIP_13800 [Microbulbifer sp. VTAC004]|uniref:hypothetical protein n=1 Tax=unclassified Microbulbifer TaxID=2619833 RepID=UPI0040397527
MSQIGGGKFGHGFISAGVGGGFAQDTHVMVKMAVTGLVSEATGGKFSNGAATAAFAAAVQALSQDDIPVAGEGEGTGGQGQGDYSQVEQEIAEALGIDGEYTIVKKRKSEIFSVTKDKNAHGTVQRGKDVNYEIWIDKSYRGKDYWTLVYHEMRHVWQKANGLTLPKNYFPAGLNNRQIRIVRNMLEYDAWRYTKYISHTSGVGLSNAWISERFNYYSGRHFDQSILGRGMPPVEITCCN